MRTAMRNRTGLYRSRHGVIRGVCRGVAEYLDFSVFWTRAIAVALLIFTGIWPIVGIYLLAMLVMKPEPLVPFESDDEAEFYNSFTHSRSMALQRLKRIYDKIDRRVQRMEDAVTAREYDWDQRLKRNM
ncbi:MAG: phage-shock protein [Candidatus Entotheonella factor]|uniref:Phage-shock protein n=1 Tax=Entotheonella factor TaxID=1429438 RepID=W4LMI4_ENTF1|nr:PspC domain-containing protein [Candidatus Entotheonella palauensis]ETW99187.1 MAG: phage-shock protein [Candidatus Entotheonella factor]